MLCIQDHVEKVSAEKKLLDALFGRDEEGIREMELVIDSPYYRKWVCPTCGWAIVE